MGQFSKDLSTSESIFLETRDKNIPSKSIYLDNQAGTVMPQIDIRSAASKITTYLGQRNDSIFSMHVIRGHPKSIMLRWNSK